MKTTAQLLLEIVEAKSDIKQALIEKGITASNKLSDYADMIRSISSSDSSNSYTEEQVQALLETTLCTPLPTLFITVGSLSIKYNSNIKIYAEDKKSYTPQLWYELSNKSTLKPIGFDVKANGEHFIIYVLNKYRDNNMTSNQKTYYNTCGYTSGAKSTDGSLKAGLYGYVFINQNYSYTDLNGTTATCTVSDDKLIYTTTNSPKTWTINKVDNYYNYKNIRLVDLSRLYKFPYSSEDIFSFYETNLEWVRHRTAINSGLSTTEEDGTVGVVTILNAEGNKPSAGEDMYFYVNGEKTDKLAKYNIHDLTTYKTTNFSLSLEIADSIYTALKTNGVNMNMSCKDSNTDSPIPILVEGQKGAEAYAYNGVWMITTPILSNCTNNSTNMTKLDYNIPDLPYIGYIYFLRDYHNDLDITLPKVSLAVAYYLNNDIIGSLTDFLRSSSGGSHKITEVPNSFDCDSFTSNRINNINITLVNLGQGFIANLLVNYSKFVVGIKELN